MSKIPSTNSDRVRSELSFNLDSRARQVGRVVHESLAVLAGFNRLIDDDEIDVACEAVLARKPINAPRRLARPMAQILSATAIGVRLMPPLDWEFTRAEISLPSGTIVDQEYRSASPVIVEDHIGDILGVELKLGASIDVATLPSTREQVHGHIDGLVAVHGERILGVATHVIGHGALSLLTLADTSRTEVLLRSTSISNFPYGRLR